MTTSAVKHRSALHGASLCDREAALLAPYAMHSAGSAGRKYATSEHPYRGPYQRDRDRITHCTAWRRLSSKTQVFTGELGDYHRTRLTHTLEVASIARTLGRALRLNEDLIEALAQFHDLGHPPFGHAGEDALNERLRDHGGFCHNRQALVIVEELEQRYPEFVGLNLTHEVLDGQRYRAEKAGRGDEDTKVEADERSPLLEVQVVDAADSIAYDSHDADDALELGWLRLEELHEIPLWRAAADRVRGRYAGLLERETARAVVHELIDWLVGDVLRETSQRFEAAQLASTDDVLGAGTLVSASAEAAAQQQELEAFLYERIYRHPQVLRVRERAAQQIDELFARFLAAPRELPDLFQQRIARVGPSRSVGDYLSCLTDRSAQALFAAAKCRA